MGIKFNSDAEVPGTVGIGHELLTGFRLISDLPGRVPKSPA